MIIYDFHKNRNLWFSLDSFSSFISLVSHLFCAYSFIYLFFPLPSVVLCFIRCSKKILQLSHCRLNIYLETIHAMQRQKWFISAMALKVSPKKKLNAWRFSHYELSIALKICISKSNIDVKWHLHRLLALRASSEQFAGPGNVRRLPLRQPMEPSWNGLASDEGEAGRQRGVRSVDGVSTKAV